MTFKGEVYCCFCHLVIPEGDPLQWKLLGCHESCWNRNIYKGHGRLPFKVNQADGGG